MGMQKIEFEFPDEKDDVDTEIEIEGVEGRQNVLEKDDPTVDVEDDKTPPAKPEKPAKAQKKQDGGEDEEDIDMEIVDDVPPEDRGKTPSEAPEDPTDEELENYSERARKRIRHYSKVYHDERRRAEQAQRDRDELEALARRLVDENKNLQGTVTKSQSTMVEQAKRAAQSNLEAAKRAYKDAYESGETDAVLEAQDKLTDARIKLDKVNSFRPKPLQKEKTPIQEKPAQSQPQTPRDERASRWANENTWFGNDDEMTAFALGLHQKLVKEGVHPQSDTYYEKINSRMRQVFPDQFEDDSEPEPEAKKSRKPSNVVAPATRSTAPKKVRLTQTQVALAKRMGIPLETYAREVAVQMRKDNER